MAGTHGNTTDATAPTPLADLLALPQKLALQLGQQAMAQTLEALRARPLPPTEDQAPPAMMPDAEEAAHWAEVATRLQAMWLDFQAEQAGKLAEPTGPAPAVAPAMAKLVESWTERLPLLSPETQGQLVQDTLALWDGLLASWGLGPKADPADADKPVDLPRSDRRFADPAWRETPFFTLVHQTYLILSEQISAMSEKVDLPPAQKEQLRFFTRAVLEALSPDHFPLTNPLVIEKALESRGDSLVKGMEHLLHDLRHRQLTHTRPEAFHLGENIAATPGKVVHRTPLYELIQYTPTTPKVATTPLLIFPPWINRFYILDLSPKKSFVRWAVEQGLSVFLVSWKSATPNDPDLDWGEVTWDDYIAAQIEAIEVVRARLKVPAVHTIGYCVAGTTLAATLAVLARRGEAEKVASATFFTAQVDFEKAGELKAFIDDQQLATMAALSAHGVMDGRWLAAAFNLLRGQDLIWSYVKRNYLLGEDYSAFDLLFWNGDTTNLPAKWHQAYLRDLYRDNLLVKPDALKGCGTPIDLSLITTPCYIQAGREDHIAPLASVWRLREALGNAARTFLLAGSGHIAGVVNPPSAKKYQYWTCPGSPKSLEAFIAGATETPGSWWPHWLEWLAQQGDHGEVPARGKRVPGGRGDKVLGDAPGEYVRQH